MGTLPHPWRGCSSEGLFSLQKISFYHDETSPDATSSWSPSSSPCAFLWIENIHPPLFKYWDTVMKCPSAFSSPGRKKSHSSFLIGQSLQLSDHLCGSPLNLLQSVSWTVVTRAGLCTSDVAQQALCRMEFSHLYYLCQYHPCRCSPGFNFLFLLQSLTWGQVRQISQGAEITIWECVIAQMHTEAQILASVGLGQCGVTGHFLVGLAGPSGAGGTLSCPLAGPAWPKPKCSGAWLSHGLYLRVAQVSSVKGSFPVRTYTLQMTKIGMFWIQEVSVPNEHAPELAPFADSQHLVICFPWKNPITKS